MATITYRNTSTGRTVEIEEPTKEEARDVQARQRQLIKSMDSSTKWERQTGESTATTDTSTIEAPPHLATKVDPEPTPGMDSAAEPVDKPVAETKRPKRK